MTIKSGDIKGFKEYSQFTNLKEFNTHIEMWLLKHKRDFSKSELIGFKRLVRFSAKYPGVCNAKIGTILKAIHEEYNENGISRSTFKRMISKAKTLGIVTVYETERKNGSQSSNLYVFNRFPTSEPPNKEKMNHHNKTNNLSKTNKNNNNKRTDDEPIHFDYTYTNSHVPTSFVQLVKICFNDAKKIEEFWKMVKIAAHKYQLEHDHEEVLVLAIDSFRQLFRKLKTTKSIKNPIAYFYGIITKKMKEFYFEELFDMGFPVETEQTTSGHHSLSLFKDWLEGTDY